MTARLPQRRRRAIERRPLHLPDSFPVLYLCTTRPCVVAEMRRLGERQAIVVESLLPRVVYRYEIQLARVLDLTPRGSRGTLASHDNC